MHGDGQTKVFFVFLSVVIPYRYSEVVFDLEGAVEHFNTTIAEKRYGPIEIKGLITPP
jgi:hypothetical protein